MKKKYVIVVFLSSVIFLVIGKEIREKEEEVKQRHIGNFALPVSQQPGPFISFGENVNDKGDLLFYMRGQQIKGRREMFAEVAPSIVYSFTDKFSILIELPIALKFKIEDAESHGPEDLIIQFERLVYASETETAANEMTVVVNVGCPTGSACQDPTTGFGSPSLFLGLTASHTNADWYFFAASAVLLPGAHKNTKFGNQIFYEFGFSRNISYRTDKWILNWTIEFDGNYRQRDTLAGYIDCNSGGNELLLGPSLWFSTQHLIVQAGFSGYVSQHLFGCQLKDKYFVAANVGWKF